jgi:polar amino acid transport system substrate-binding protein
MVACSAVSIANAQSTEGYWQEVQKRGVLKCGAATAPPHVIRDPKTGTFSGTFIELCQQFADKVLGVPAEIVDTSWDNIVAGLQSNRWDLALALNATPKRALAIAFSTPVVNYQITAVMDKANPKLQGEVKSLADLDKTGVNIVVMSGTATAAAVSPQVKNATILQLPDVDATRLALSSRRADVLVDDSDTNDLFAATNRQRWKIIIPDPAIAKQGIAYGLRRTASYADVNVLNYFLQEKIAIGEVDKLVKTYVEKSAIEVK